MRLQVLRKSHFYLHKLGCQYRACGYWPLLGGLGSHSKKKEQAVWGMVGYVNTVIPEISMVLLLFFMLCMTKAVWLDTVRLSLSGPDEDLTCSLHICVPAGKTVMRQTWCLPGKPMSSVHRLSSLSTRRDSPGTHTMTLMTMIKGKMTSLNICLDISPVTPPPLRLRSEEQEWPLSRQMVLIWSWHVHLKVKKY